MAWGHKGGIKTGKKEGHGEIKRVQDQEGVGT